MITRLTTEAEWEYACRAGTTTMFHSGNNLGDMYDVGWCWENSNDTPHPVVQKQPNAWGLYDMHGNVEELCSDWYDSSYYEKSPSKNPKGPENGETIVTRGGNLKHNDRHARSAIRGEVIPEFRFYDIGFRLVRNEK